MCIEEKVEEKKHFDNDLGMGKKKDNSKRSGTDPKAAALAFLGINLGSKNIRMLTKEEVNSYFVKQLHISETM